MYTFGRMENVESLFDEVEVLEAAIACELNAQDTDATRTVAEIQADIDASEKEIVRHYEIIISKHAEREMRVAAVHEEGRRRLEDLRRKLADAKHELTVINSPILILPYEITAEIFNYHMLMGGDLTNALLVCKLWASVGKSSPRLWSRIAVTNLPLNLLRLQGAVRCNNLDQLRSVLAHSQFSPLQVELSFSSYVVPFRSDDSWQSSTGRVEAVKLIFDNQILRRCTFLALGNYYLPLDYQDAPVAVEHMTILPMLSSIRIYTIDLRHTDLSLIQSLIKLSPLLRHIRCDTRSLSLQDLGVGIWPKRIETYGWIFSPNSYHSLHESPSLRELGIYGNPIVPLTLPALQVLRWAISTYSGLYIITAPRLHTLVLHHPIGSTERPSAGSITLPNLRVAVHSYIIDLTILHCFVTPALEHLSIGCPASSPTALFELFDGSAHMPAPKSLHIHCAFTDAALIAVLGRLPLLEELQVAGTIAQDTFWEALTPSGTPSWRVWLPRPCPDERATRILTPNLKVLLVNYSMDILYTPPKPRPMKSKRMTRKQRTEIAQAPELADEGSRGGGWTVMQALAIAAARERAGCRFEILACWSPEQNVEVLIGNFETIPHRPKWVPSTAL